MSTILTALAVVAATTPGLLVTPAELAAALKDPTAVVLTIANAPADFEAGHVPGARFIRYGDIAPDQSPLRSELPHGRPPARDLCRRRRHRHLEDLHLRFAHAGVAAVLHAGLPRATPQVKMLNGGLNAWKASGGAIETGRPQIRHRLGTDKLHGARRAQPHRVVECRMDQRPAGNAQRSRCSMRGLMPEFTGADGGMGGMHVAGHLPGAQQLVWNTLFDSTGKFLPDAELRKKFEAHRRRRPARRSSATAWWACAHR